MSVLDGFSVVTIAQNVPGPAAAARMRALGAQVRKVEPPAGDPLQKIAAAWYDALHRGCSVKTLDLKTEADRRVMDGFLAEAD
ncbi:MAG: CoA transferase, partial [Candidatus Eremiobacteraeota bacterium]|nr:CoA transferase [Candidatus Eremiobacteraeota bacterium]